MAHAGAARLSRKLVVLCDSVPLPQPIEDLVARPVEQERLQAWLATQGFRSIATRLGLEASAKASARPAPLDPGDRSAPFGAPAPHPAPSEGAIPDATGYGPYETITTLDALHAFLAEAVSAGMLALGVETDGVEAVRAALVGFTLAVAPGRAAYVPLRHDLLVGPQIDPEEAMNALAPVLADRSVLKVLHDAKFGLAVLERAGAPAGTAPVDDTMLISYAQNAGRNGHDLAELAGLHLGQTMMGLDAATGTGRARHLRGCVFGSRHRLCSRGGGRHAPAMARVAAPPAGDEVAVPLRADGAAAAADHPGDGAGRHPRGCG